MTGNLLKNQTLPNTKQPVVSPTTDVKDFVTTRDRNLISAESNDEHISCPVCACAMTGSDELQICETCDTPHHKDCWEYTGGCAIFGCRKGALRKFEEGRRHEYQLTILNFGIMKLWGKLLYVDLVLYLGAHYSSLALGLMVYYSTILSLLILAIDGLVSIQAIIYIWMTCLLFSIIPMLSLFGYLLIFTPKILMKLHFWLYRIPSSKNQINAAIRVADRVELPQGLINFGNLLYKKGKAITLTSMKPISVASGIIMLLLIYSCISMKLPIYLAFWLCFCCFCSLAAALRFLYYVCENDFDDVQVCMEDRLKFITSFQNRVIASAKKSKE